MIHLPRQISQQITDPLLESIHLLTQKFDSCAVSMIDSRKSNDRSRNRDRSNDRGPEIDLAPDQETDIIEGTDQTLEIGQLQETETDITETEIIETRTIETEITEVETTDKTIDQTIGPETLTHPGLLTKIQIVKRDIGKGKTTAIVQVVAATIPIITTSNKANKADLMVNMLEQR